MDSRDREIINKNIDSLYENQKRLSHFWNKSISFLESQLDDYSTFKEFKNVTLQQIQETIKRMSINYDPSEVKSTVNIQAIIADIGLNRNI